MILGYSIQMLNHSEIIAASEEMRRIGLQREAERRGLTLYGDVYEHRTYGNLVPSGETETVDDGEPIELVVWENCDSEDATYVRITLESRAK